MIYQTLITLIKINTIGIYHIVVGSFNYVQLDVQLGVADSPLQIMLIFIINPQRFHTHTRNTLTPEHICRTYGMRRFTLLVVTLTLSTVRRVRSTMRVS